MFDCGEGTQNKLQSTTAKLPAMSKIFITHLHGDHLYGLQGLLCGMGQARNSVYRAAVDGNSTRKRSTRKPTVSEKVELYGPVGLRAYLRAIAEISFATFCPYVVHELVDVPRVLNNGKEVEIDRSTVHCSGEEPSLEYGEQHGGTQVERDADGFWTVVDSKDGMLVRAAAMSHTVPTVGYVIEEPPTYGTLDVDQLRPLIHQNYSALIESGKNDPMSIIRDIKLSEDDELYVLPDGTKLNPKDFRGPNKRGRKVAIMGDTSNASKALKLALDADLLIHECTNFTPSTDKNIERKHEKTMSKRGHSVPRVAGAFARDARVKHLVMNHFSQQVRQRGDIQLIRERAARAANLPLEKVDAAKDFLVVKIPFDNPKKKEKNISNEEWLSRRQQEEREEQNRVAANKT